MSSLAVTCARRGRLQRVADDVHAVAGSHACEPAPERIVQVDDGMAQRRPREELRLRRAVAGERPVIVEMVAREIGEERHVEGDTRQPVLHEADRRNLQADGLCAGTHEPRERAMQPQRIRCRIRRRPQPSRCPVAQRADRRTGTTGCAQRLREPLAARRLAVSAGNADRPQPRRRCTIYGVRDLADAASQSYNAPIRHAPARIPTEARRRIPQHTASTLRQRLRDEAAAILCLAGIGDEGVTGLDRAAVADESAQRERVGGRFALRGRHTSSFTSGISPDGMTTLRVGASGGMDNRRSAPDITFAKTGPATVPP